MPYDDFISTQYDEYQSPLFHLSANAAHNSDIYGRMYSDRNHLGDFFFNSLIPHLSIVY